MYNKNLAWIFDVMFFISFYFNITGSFEGCFIRVGEGITSALDTADID